MKVYILMRGEDYEGGHVHGVFSTREGAAEAARAVPSCFSGWRETAPGECWKEGCDWMTVNEYSLSN